MVDIEKRLMEHLKNINTAPFLFIGSGFSRRYIGLENWEGLLKKFSELVPYDFDYYVSTGRKEWEEVAELMAKDFHGIWWKDNEYIESRKEFKGKIANDQSPLKIEIAKYLRDSKYDFGLSESNDSEIKELKKVVIDGIITTNWDLLLEQIFSEHDMKVYIGQKELLFSQPLEINEIYKIHGCSSDPDSLVLTSRDYKDFNDRNPYLAAKLLTIFIEHPVIFIGYSISDKNILQILNSITACLDKENINKLKDRLIFLERAGGEEDSFESASITVNKLTIPITNIKTDKFDRVYRALSKNKRKFSMRMMRKIKSQLYEIVKTNDPNEKIHVVDENAEDFENVEFVIGVGVKSVAEQIQSIKEISATTSFAQKGYKTISNIELFKEILSDNQNYDYNLIVQETLPELLKTYHTIPVNKYVSLSNIEEKDLDYKIQKKLSLEYDDFLTKAQKCAKKELAWEWQFICIEDVIEGYPEFNTALCNIPALGPDKINIDELKSFLQKHLSLLEDKGNEGANIRRLFRIYDWLRYKKHN